MELIDDDRRLVDQPNLPRPVGLGAREKSNGGVDAVLLVPEVEDVAVGLGRVENAVGTGEGLDQAMMLEVLVDVECVEELCVKAGEEHIHDDGHVNLFVAPCGGRSLPIVSSDVATLCNDLRRD